MERGEGVDKFWGNGLLCKMADFHLKISIESLHFAIAINCLKRTSLPILKNRYYPISLLFCRGCSLSFHTCLGAIA